MVSEPWVLPGVLSGYGDKNVLALLISINKRTNYAFYLDGKVRNNYKLFAEWKNLTYTHIKQYNSFNRTISGLEQAMGLSD
jgi:hypothetical protein